MVRYQRAFMCVYSWPVELAPPHEEPREVDTRTDGVVEIDSELLLDLDPALQQAGRDVDGPCFGLRDSGNHAGEENRIIAPIRLLERRPPVGERRSHVSFQQMHPAPDGQNPSRSGVVSART